MEHKNTVTPDVLTAFRLPVQSHFEVLVGGHINDSFLVTAPEGKFTVQHINRFVFPSPEDIMDNISSVTHFLREKIIRAGGDPNRECLNVRTTADGASVYRDTAGEYWRCMAYIDGARAYETAAGPEMLREAGRAFGRFQNMLADYPAGTLHEILPNFHNTPVRFQNLMDAVKADKVNRKSGVESELAFTVARERDCSLLTDLLARGKLPLRVTHNDTKMSNVLIDDETGKAICVIDLDTVMPGLAAFDFGDSIRAGASTAAEDEADLSKVKFDLSQFGAYTQGFLETAGSALTETELSTLPDGARMMTLEVGIRFLEDYLRGDVYFRTAYPEHNLVRARNQFKLVEEMEKSRSQMDQVIAKYKN